ncbi:MAG: cell division protein FtsW [Proteobacteria bacterium]|nr:cell division protein FtsW [Pseudomonadota bacterium]
MTRLFSRTDQSVFGRWWWTVDRVMLAGFFILMVCGVVLVATASPPVAERIGAGQYHFIKKHMIVLFPAFFLMLGVSLLPPRMIWRVSSIVFAGGIIAMILVLFIGVEVKGAQRWLPLPFFSLQPSEFIKPAFAVCAAWFMAKGKENPSFRGNAIAAGMFGLAALLLVMQPDFGMTFVLACIFGMQVFLAGFPLLWLAGLAGAGVCAGVLSYFTIGHVRSRIDRFLDPAYGDNYQVEKSLEAFRAGGLFGVGPGQGTVKLGIPDAHADFIFAVAGEEMGLLFAAFLVILFGFIVLRGFNRIMDSDDMFTVLAGGGLLTMFGFQALIHMGAGVRMLPAKGMTLPFISYGGSSLLAMSFAAGVMLALTRRKGRHGIARGGGIAKGGMAVAGKM